ncbi:MAG: hypothetical protein JWM68_185, partial [Verrucomicrobiales bacterium]|nr:hypothetical protein [Verrucomicrobiales bacterium]
MSSVIQRIILLIGALTISSATAQTNALEEVFNSRLDLWGDRAMQQSNGASYEFFEKLLPPLRYVNADFRFYPIVLGAPNGRQKARLISNGSGVNLRANVRSWHEFTYPVMFRVGPGESPFGEHLQRLDGPHLVEVFLPIVQFSYEHGGGTYQLETFALVDPVYSCIAV